MTRYLLAPSTLGLGTPEVLGLATPVATRDGLPAVGTLGRISSPAMPRVSMTIDDRTIAPTEGMISKPAAAMVIALRVIAPAGENTAPDPEICIPLKSMSPEAEIISCAAPAAAI